MALPLQLGSQPKRREGRQRLTGDAHPTQKKNICLKSRSGWHRQALRVPSPEVVKRIVDTWWEFGRGEATLQV